MHVYVFAQAHNMPMESKGKVQVSFFRSHVFRSLIDTLGLMGSG